MEGEDEAGGRPHRYHHGLRIGANPVLGLVIVRQGLAQFDKPLGGCVALWLREGGADGLDDAGSRRRGGLAHFEVADAAARRLDLLGERNHLHGVEGLEAGIGGIVGGNRIGHAPAYPVPARN